MEFWDEHGRRIDTTQFEVDEQRLAKEYIHPNCVVLELGARYGTVSCAINRNLLNPRNQVSVEPDSQVWDALERNKYHNKCEFMILKGCISRVPLHVSLDGYATTTQQSDVSNIYSCTLEDVEKSTGLVFDTLVADCEGFIEQFFDENPKLYTQLKIVMFEKDQPHRCDYAKIEANLAANGFQHVLAGFQSIWKKD